MDRDYQDRKIRVRRRLLMRSGNAGRLEMRVVVYTRQACPLCAEATAVARTVFGTENVALVDVDLDIELLETYSNRVPVVETTEGHWIAEGAVSESELRDFDSRH